MAFRKNKKFIDPRYFMDEKMETIKEEDENTIKEWESQHAAMQRYASRADQPQAAPDPDPDYDFPTLWDRITDMIRNAPQMEQSNMLAKIQNDLRTLR